MMSAAMMGATAFQKGLGAVHALSHPIGAMYNTHHGTTNAVCMPAVLDMNASEISQQFDQVAGYIGIKNGFKGFCVFVRELNASLKIPMKLSGLGVANVDVEKLTEAALKDPSCGGNPVKLNSENVTELIKDLL
jgi:alcohol dehydrogenase class IV